MFPIFYCLTLTKCQNSLHRYHIFSNTMGKYCILAINKHKGKWHFIDDFKNPILFIASSTAGSSCCWVLCILHIFAFRKPNPTLYSLSLTLYVICIHHQTIHRQVRLIEDTSNFILLYFLFFTVWPQHNVKKVSPYFLRFFWETYLLLVLLALCHQLHFSRKNTFHHWVSLI